MMRLVVFVSGNGSNLQAIINAIEAGHLDAQITAVVSNRKNAYGLERADQADIKTIYFPLKPYKDKGLSRTDYDADLAELVAECEPDLIVLAGWMHILSSEFLDHFPQKVINLHPALPKQFDGTHAIERAYEAFRQGEIMHSGIMVHYAIPEVDAGEVIIQAHVPILQEDTLEDFEARMHRNEHTLLIQAIAMLADKLFS